MALPKNLISQFAKTVVDKKDTKKETFIQANVVEELVNGKCHAYVNDPSNSFPVSMPTNVDKHQPVTIMIKHNKATVIGNVYKTGSDDGNTKYFNPTSSSVDSIPNSDIDALWN